MICISEHGITYEISKHLCGTKFVSLEKMVILVEISIIFFFCNVSFFFYDIFIYIHKYANYICISDYSVKVL